jgi:gliding motility-associated lipoprotein GldD
LKVGRIIPDLNLTSLNASIHCSYYEISGTRSLTSLVNDAFNLAGKHNIKANYRKESVIDNGSGVKGILFEIDGPVASPLQFYITDEKKHFFRASLYFNATVNPDSTAPVLQFLRPDLDTLISTFSWR